MILQNQILQGNVKFVNKTVKETDIPVDETAERIHYLPHHAVLHRDKDTTKVRVV